MSSSRDGEASWRATLTAIAAGRGPLEDREQAALGRVIEGLAQRTDDAPWFVEALLARDLHAVELRLGGASIAPLSAWAARLRLRCDAAFAVDRARLAAGELRGPELLRWLAAHAPAQRDLALELLLDIAFAPFAGEPLPPSPERSDYIPSGVAPLVRMVHEIPIGEEDVFVDLGSGLGKATMLVHLLSGATARGLELKAELVALANERAARWGMGAVRHVEEDARAAELGDATVIYLYLPFTGSALTAALARVRALAQERSVVVCALGLSLDGLDWLVPRASQGTEDLWLTLYETRVAGVPPRVAQRSPDDPLASALAAERPHHG